MNTDILCINSYINLIEKDFLENINNKYINICKNLYGANLDKINIHLWTMHIMGEFKENIIKSYRDIYNMEEISEEIYKIVKADRKKMILYGYLKGNTFGYNDYMINNKYKNINECIDSKKYIDFIINSTSNIENIKILRGNLEKYFFQNMEINLLSIRYDCDKCKLYKIIRELIIKDVINNYNKGILDGITHKINKKSSKNNKMGL